MPLSHSTMRRREVKNAIRPIKTRSIREKWHYKAITIARDLEKQWHSDVHTVFDIGAADGEYSMHFLKAFPQAKVYSFEPQTASYEKLARKTRPFSERIVLNKFGFIVSREARTSYCLLQRCKFAAAESRRARASWHP